MGRGRSSSSAAVRSDVAFDYDDLSEPHATRNVQMRQAYPKVRSGKVFRPFPDARETNPWLKRPLWAAMRGAGRLCLAGPEPHSPLALSAAAPAGARASRLCLG